MTEQEWRKNFARAIRCRIMALHIDQRELARRAGITEDVISNYVRCCRMPSAWTLFKLAQALECSVADLIEFREPME